MSARLIVKKGPKKGLEIDLSQKPSWVIGSSTEECDIVLDDPSLPPVLAKIEKKEGKYIIRNLADLATFLVNDLPIKTRHTLQEADTLQLGKTFFTFSEKTQEKASRFDDIFDSPIEEEPDILSQDIQKEEETLSEEPLLEPEETEAEEDEKNEYGKTAYDTIFEDSEDLENLPFNLVGEAPYLLKVIAGPNTGAEIAVQKNCSYIMGKDPNSCDIVFQDLSVSRNHAKLSVDAQGNLEIEDLGAKNKTLLDGQPIEGKSPLTFQNLVQMGTTTFIVIDREGNAETIYSPFAEKAKEEGKEEELEEVEEEEPEKVAWKEQIIPKSHLMIAAACFLLLFSVFISFFSLFKSEPIALSGKKAKEMIAEATKGYEGVQYSFNPSSGKLFLVGHVLSPVQHQELLYNLDQIPYVESVEDNVVIDELVWKDTNDVLTENASFKSVMIYAPAPGKFVVSGYVAKEEDKEALNDYLNVNFPYLDRLHNEVVVETILQQEVASNLLKEGFSAVSFQLTDGDLVLGGRFDGKRKKAFRNLLEAFRSMPGIHQIKNLAIASDSSAASIDLSDKYQVTGTVKKDQDDYNVVINGKILAVGENMDGMILTKILSNRILLEKDGILYRIDYNP